MKRIIYAICIAIPVILCACSENNTNKPDITETTGVESPYDSNGAIKNGKFSVSPYTKVKFSRGNLEYLASTDTWRFAEQQYQYSGSIDISSTSTSWFSVFGWATSGYDNKYPYLNGDRYDQGYYTGKNDIAGTNYDWGVYNAITNGGNRAGMVLHLLTGRLV